MKIYALKLVFEFCFFGGYFNAILNSADKRGGVTLRLRSQIDFEAFMGRNHLFHIPTANGSFTSTNQRLCFCSIIEKLDRFFFKGNMGTFPYSMECKILLCFGSDHFSILLEILGENHLIRCPFKFEAMWMKDQNFLPLISVWWEEVGSMGSKMFTLATKLKHIKYILKD